MQIINNKGDIINQNIYCTEAMLGKEPPCHGIERLCNAVLTKFPFVFCTTTYYTMPNPAFPVV